MPKQPVVEVSNEQIISQLKFNIMSEFEQGPLGNVNGKIGNAVVAKWKGNSFARKTPSKSSKPPTVKQLTQQMRMSLVGEFFNRISPVIAVGYSSVANRITQVNVAVKDHINKIITGVYPNFKLDFTKVVLSKPSGKTTIDGGGATKVTPVAGYGVEIDWSVFNSGSGDNPSLATDRLYVVIYNEEQHKFMMFRGIADRSELHAKVNLPFLMKDNTLYVYVFFASADRVNVSHSEYLGKIVLLP
jgi:hypothetical protein